MTKSYSTKLLWLFFVAIAISALWVFWALTPSHYAVALQRLGVDAEPLLGQEKDIRSDEWGVLTPLFQQAVLNKFQRYSEIGVTREDLRGVWGLPLKDWAIIFKPYFWGFFFLPPANAFSLYHLSMIISFISGMGIFLRLIGLPIVSATLLALILFFSHHNQAWWGSNAACLALTVWIWIPIFLRQSNWVVLLSSFFATAAALLGQLYPAWQISQLFIFGCLILAFRPDVLVFRRLVAWGVGVILGAATTYCYLADIIPVVANTIYPGQVLLESGGHPLRYLFYNLFPHLSSTPNFDVSFSEPLSNICEEGAVASWLLLIAISFINYKNALAFCKAHRKGIAVVLGALLFIYFRMYVPLLFSLENLFLFNKVSPKRAVLAFGTLLTILIGILFVNSGLRISLTRILFFSLLGSLGQVAVASHYGMELDVIDFSFLLFPLLLLAARHWSIFKSKRDHQYDMNTSLAIVLLLNLSMFGNFNVIQSAHEIFSQSRWNNVATFLRQLDPSQQSEVIGVEGSYSSVLTGIGLPTPSQVYRMPMTLEERQQFSSGLDKISLDHMFNRYHYTTPRGDVLYPSLLAADNVEVPLRIYTKPLKYQETDLTRKNRNQENRLQENATLIGTGYFSEAATKTNQSIAFYTIPNSNKSIASLKITQTSKSKPEILKTNNKISAMYFLDQQDLIELVTAEPGSKNFSSHIAIFVENYTTLSNSENITLSDARKDYILPRPTVIKTIENIPDSSVELP